MEEQLSEAKVAHLVEGREESGKGSATKEIYPLGHAPSDLTLLITPHLLT